MAEPRAKPNFACVRFENEKEKTFIKNVSDIKIRAVRRRKYVLQDFRPENDEDFVKNAWYYVKWICEPTCYQSHSHTSFLKANIIMMGGKFCYISFVIASTSS